MAKRGTATFDLGVRGNLRRVQRGIMRVRNRLLDDVELPEEEAAIKDLAAAAIGAINIVGHLAQDVKRLADAKQQEADALQDLADRAKQTHQD